MNCEYSFWSLSFKGCREGETNYAVSINPDAGYWFLSFVKIEVIAKYALFDNYCILEVFFFNNTVCPIREYQD